jgi:hypothetical protein
VQTSGTSQLKSCRKEGRLTMPSPFDFINDLSYGKKNLLEQDPNNLKDYNAWMINRGLSNFHDTVEYANNMNMLYNLDKELQHAYFINIIRPRKRFAKWHKKNKDSDLELVMQYYSYSVSKAKTALSILTPEQLEHIKSELQEAGNDR